MYNEIIFTTFEDAKKARKMLSNIYKDVKLGFATHNIEEPYPKVYIVIDEILDYLYNSDISCKLIKHKGSDDTKHGYILGRHIGIYEYVNDEPSKGFIFEEPIAIPCS